MESSFVLLSMQGQAVVLCSQGLPQPCHPMAGRRHGLHDIPVTPKQLVLFPGEILMADGNGMDLLVMVNTTPAAFITVTTSRCKEKGTNVYFLVWRKHAHFLKPHLTSDPEKQSVCGVPGCPSQPDFSARCLKAGFSGRGPSAG